MTDVTRTPGTDLRSLATEINRLHASAEGHVNDALYDARDCGGLLLDAKSRLEHGEWGRWVGTNFDGSYRSARRYMRIAEHWPEIEEEMASVANLGIQGAIRLLAEPRDTKDDEPTDSTPTNEAHDPEPPKTPDSESSPEDTEPSDEGVEGEPGGPFGRLTTMGQRQREDWERKQETMAGARSGEDEKVVDINSRREPQTEKEWVDEHKKDVSEEVDESAYGRVLDFVAHVIEEPETFTDEEIIEAVHDPDFPRHWMKAARQVYGTLGRIIATTPEAEEGEDHASAQ